MRDRIEALRGWLTSLVLASSLIGCQATPPLNAPGQLATVALPPILTLDAANIVDHMAHQNSVSWQDNAIQPTQVREKRRASGYKVAAAAGTSCWNANIGACSNVPAFVHVQTNPYAYGNAPVAGDALFAVNDAVPAVVYKINPGVGATCPTGTPSTATTLSLTGHSVKQSAILPSADNKRIYILTNDGWLYSINVGTFTLTTGGTNPVQLPTAAGANAFAGRAPFLDASQVGGPVFGTDEVLYAVDSAGVIFNVHLYSTDPPGSTQLNATPVISTITPTYNPPLGANTISNFPIVWKGIAYLGSSGGIFYSVNTATPGTVNAWDLRSYSTAATTAQAIVAPVAIDFDNSLNTNAIFVPYGDKVFWLDPAVAGTPKAISPSLGLDHTPATSYGPVSSVVGTSGTYTATVDDWISIAKSALNAPKSWSAVSTSTYGATAVNVASVKRDVSSDIWFSVYAPNPTYTERSAPNGTANATTPTNTFQPNEITVDSAGTVYAANANGTLSKYANNGSVVGGFTNNAVANPLWPQIDNTGAYLWVTDYVNGKVWRLNSNGTNSGNGSPWTVTGPYSIACDSSNNIWVTTVPGNGSQGKLLKFTQAGSTFANYTTANLINPVYVECSPATGNPWIACNTNATTNNILEFNKTLSTWINHADGYIFPYAINFDKNPGANNGDAWICHTDNFGGSGTPRIVAHMNGTLTTTKAIYNNSVLGADPQEITFDGVDGTWIACNGKILNIFDIGNQADLFAAPFYKQTIETPVDNSYAYMRFKIPFNQFGGGPVTSATLSLMAANTTSQTEHLNLYQASNLTPAGTGPWVGYVSGSLGTNNVDAGNSPVLGGLAAPQATGTAITKYATLNFNLNGVLPADQVNAPLVGPGNAYYSYAFTNADSYVLNQVTHWFSNATQSLGGDPAAVAPQLKISYLTSSAIGATGLACQPSIISYDVPSVTRRLVVGASNALIELDYSSVANFQDPTKVYYNMSQTGQSVGPVDAAKKYLFPTGNVLVTENLRLVMADANPTGAINLNSFDGNLPASSAVNRLKYYDPLANTGAGNVKVGQQMLYDYQSGYVYCTTTNGYIYRESVLQ